MTVSQKRSAIKVTPENAKHSYLNSPWTAKLCRPCKTSVSP